MNIGRDLTISGMIDVELKIVLWSCKLPFKRFPSAIRLNSESMREKVGEFF